MDRFNSKSDTTEEVTDNPREKSEAATLLSPEIAQLQGPGAQPSGWEGRPQRSRKNHKD